MKIKPILFSTEMVKANLDGRKNQTRRIVKEIDTGILEHLLKNTKNLSDFISRTAKYQVGDILWVRETWGLNYFGSTRFWHFKERLHINLKDIVYKASTKNEYSYNDNSAYFLLDKIWKPSIHMPKEAARIFLKVTNVRCERLQDISEEDARAEGVLNIADWHNEGKENYFWKDYLDSSETVAFFNAINSFQSLWDKINGKDSWLKNPLVWVYEYEQTEKPENFLTTK